MAKAEYWSVDDNINIWPKSWKTKDDTESQNDDYVNQAGRRKGRAMVTIPQGFSPNDGIGKIGLGRVV